MKPGRRALGVAESYRGTDDEKTQSTLAGAVVRADRTVDDLVFAECTVGGTDATDAIVDAWHRLGRADVSYLLLSGVAPAWYNVVDLGRLAAAVDRPVLAVAYEDSDGLADAIAEAFDPPARGERLATYEALPERRRLEEVGDGPLFVRCTGIEPDAADRALAAFTHERRPEPVRVAKRAARAADDFRRD
ncbi:DUF99 domain-containing protein [Halobacteriales archaeon QH_7_69_31]|nr:MAG: DUF99 domain-containing protein [Halobacteriales archaeon QH_7_69_31]